MPIPKVSDKDFVRVFEEHGPMETARRLGMNKRKVFERRSNLERKLKRQIMSPSPLNTRQGSDHASRVRLDIKDGIVLVASDGHYWPGRATTAHRAFVKFCKEIPGTKDKPSIIVMNGDAFDGAQVSRHPAIGWEDKPTVAEELEAVQERLSEIECAAPKNAKLVWPLGNHDARFETRLATMAREYARIHGFHLKDHVGARWVPCWSLWINGEVVIKHRWKGGAHATHNAAVESGKTMITGHLHSLKVTPFNDYNGTRYGVDTGCLADPYGPMFADYSEDNPRNHRSGFVVLTFIKGELQWPEVVNVISEGRIGFRGKIYNV